MALHLSFQPEKACFSPSPRSPQAVVYLVWRCYLFYRNLTIPILCGFSLGMTGENLCCWSQTLTCIVSCQLGGVRKVGPYITIHRLLHKASSKRYQSGMILEQPLKVTVAPDERQYSVNRRCHPPERSIHIGQRLLNGLCSKTEDRGQEAKNWTWQQHPHHHSSDTLESSVLPFHGSGLCSGATFPSTRVPLHYKLLTVFGSH